MDHYPLPKILKHPVTILRPTEVLRIEGVPYISTGRRLDGLNLVHHDHPGQTLFLTYADIHARIEAKTAKIETDGNTPELHFLELLFNGKRFEEFGEKPKRVARLREALFLKYDEECLAKGHIDRSSDDFDLWILPQWKKMLGPVRSDSVNTISSPSVSTFNRLYRQWVDYNRNILAIMPRYTGPSAKPLMFSAESLNYAVVEARNYMSALKLQKIDVFRLYEAAVHKENEQREAEGKLKLHKFEKTKFYEIIDSFPPFDVMAAREGEEAARKHFAPNLRIYDETFLGQRLEIDEWKSDLMTFWAQAGMLAETTEEQRKFLKKIRVWLVVVIDVATRYILAVKVTATPNSQAALDALRLVMTDKTYMSEAAGATTPWIGKVKPTGTVYMDHGSAFLSEQTVDTFRALRVAVTRPETGNAKKRPHIESLFHTIGPLFTQFFHGRTFRNILEKGDYDPKAHASLAAEEFNEIIIRGICDVYNIKDHGSLGGQSPHNRLVEVVEGYGWSPPPDPMEMIRAFGKLDTATIGRYGIVKLGIPYNSEWLVEQLMEIGQKPLNMYHDLGYLNSIVVQGVDGGWVEVENKIDLPDNLTEAEWSEARRETLAGNRAETDKDYTVMRDAILKNREIGKAAALRAGLNPAVATPAKLKKQRRHLYRNFAVTPVSGSSIPSGTAMLPPPDELRGDVSAPPPPPLPAGTPQTPIRHDAPTMPEENNSRFQRNKKWEDD